MEQIKMVTLPLAEYNELIEDQIRLKMIFSACYNKTDIRYDGELRIDEDSLILALQTVDAARYKQALAAVEAKREA